MKEFLFSRKSLSRPPFVTRLTRRSLLLSYSLSVYVDFVECRCCGACERFPSPPPSVRPSVCRSDRRCWLDVFDARTLIGCSPCSLCIGSVDKLITAGSPGKFLRITSIHGLLLFHGLVDCVRYYYGAMYRQSFMVNCFPSRLSPDE